MPRANELSPDWFYKRPYDPVPQEQAPPEDWDEEPVFKIRMGADWVGHIVGLIIAGLDQPDAFKGTDEQIDHARQQVREIVASLAEDVETMAGIIDIQINANEQIEYTTDGVTWTPISPRIVPNRHPSFEAEVSVSGEARFPNMSLNAASFADNTQQDFYSRGIGGTPRLTGRISAQHETPGEPTPTRFSLEAFSSGWHKALEVGANSGVPEIGFFGRPPTNRKTIVGEIPLGPTYELAQAMLQYGLIGGAIVGVDPPPAVSDEFLMDVTMGENCTLQIWRFSGETPVIWREIDLRDCLARYTPNWTFDSIFTLGPTENEQWDVTNGSMVVSDGLIAQDVNPGGGTSFISTSNAVWTFNNRQAVRAIEVSYEVASGATWSGMAIGIYVDFSAHEEIEIDPTPGASGLLRWEAPGDLEDILSIRVGAAYEWDSIANTDPNVKITGVRIIGTGDEITEAS